MWTKKFIEFVSQTPDDALDQAIFWIVDNTCQDISITKVSCEVVESKWNATVFYERLVK